MNDEGSTPNQTNESSDGGAEIQSTQPPDPVKKAQPQADSELQDVKRELTGYERSTLRTTWVIVVINLITCFFVGLQWHEMKSGSVDTHTLAVAAGKQADKMANVSDAANEIRQAAQDMVKQDQRIADNAGNSLDASNRQSKAALGATVASSHLDQRAWLTVSGFRLSGEPTLNVGVTVTISVANTGRTPALALVNQSKLFFWNVEPPDTNFALPTNPISEAIVTPGISGTQFTTDPLTLKSLHDMDFYTGGGYKIYLEALIRYKDTFGNSHWTRVCAYHASGAPLNEFQYCEHGNEIDQEGDKAN